MKYDTVFKDEYEEGKFYEELTRQQFIAAGYEVEFVDENNKEERKKYDLKITKNGLTKYVEVKFDKSCIIGRDGKEGTGNLFFEYKSRGEPSCLSITKADYFIIWLTQNNYIIFNNLKRLKRELRSKNYVEGGDKNSSLGKIIELKNLSNYFGEVDGEEKIYKFKIE